MDNELDELRARLRQIEDDFERAIDARRASFHYQVARGRVIFEAAAIAEHRRIKVGLIRFLRGTSIGAALIAPFIYVLIVPIMLLDVSIWLYQRVCFSVWGIAPVKRADYIVVDRHRLAYLNLLQKINCLYCGYANGVIAHAREVAALTEQYWCPIKHAVRVKGTHDRYKAFLDYGDAKDLADRLQAFRSEINDRRGSPG
jgi:hypothetical protein